MSSERSVAYRGSRIALGASRRIRDAIRAARYAPFLLLSACELDTTAIPPTTPRLVVHSVLSASAAQQFVLLERSRAGLVTLLAPPFDVTDPVLTDDSIAVSDAVIELTTPGGQTLVAIEDLVSIGKGAGVYRFQLPGSALQRGGVYRLSVRAPDGELLTAEASVPGGSPAPFPGFRRWDRSGEPLALEWPAAPGARSYLVRIETPYGPHSFFTDSTRVRLPGTLRNTDREQLPRVFLPGYQQSVTVSAVDSNYYDYFRTHNSALTGSGIVSRVRGGLGVFGALVRLRFETLDVVVPQTEPVAGQFLVCCTPAEVIGSPNVSMTLYLESRASRSDQPDALSGSYVAKLQGTRNLLGTIHRNQVVIALLGGTLARDTVDLYVGELRGDTLHGQYQRNKTVARFVKQKQPPLP